MFLLPLLPSLCLPPAQRHEQVPCLLVFDLPQCFLCDQNYTKKVTHIFSYLTHSFILRKEEAPGCVACNAVIRVKHILFECTDLLEIRQKCFEEKALYSLFRNVSPEIIFDFLREIGVYYKT